MKEFVLLGAFALEACAQIESVSSLSPEYLQLTPMSKAFGRG